MSLIELHLFTNSTVNSPSTTHIEETYQSFLDTFKANMKITVWCDPNPNTNFSKEYSEKLSKLFPKVVPTVSLSDGYTKAVRSSDCDFLFMLEHDWIFLPTITNTLEEILDQMQDDKIMHLRFNKRQTVVKLSDKFLTEKKGKSFSYCVTPSVSNNPHIIARKLYSKKALKYLQSTNGSKGIEEVLSSQKEILGAIYGPLDYPKTCEHINGRQKN